MDPKPPCESVPYIRAECPGWEKFRKEQGRPTQGPGIYGSAENPVIGIALSPEFDWKIVGKWPKSKKSGR
jgi:hypothetical protein